MKGKNFIIPLGTYPFDVMVSIDEADDQLKKLLKKLNVPQDYIDGIQPMVESVRGRHILLENNQTIIRLKIAGRDKYEVIGNISHEVFHAVTVLFDRIGMRFCLESSDEAYAYAVQYLMTAICRELKL